MTTIEPRTFIIGCGRMGQIRARCLQQLGMTISGVYDSNEDRAATTAAEYKCPVVSDLESLDLGSRDIVFFCTPPGTRKQLPEKLAARGVSLFLEKPVGLSAAALQAFNDSGSGADAIIAVGYMNRCRNSVRELKTALAQEQPLSIQGRWVNAPYSVPWWNDKSLSGGPFNEQATHLVDMFLLLCGDVKRVYSSCNLATDQGLTVASTLEFHSNALGTLVYSCGATFKEIGLSVFTAKQTHRLEGWEFSAPLMGGSPSVEGDRNAIFKVETAEFLEAVRQRNQNLVPCGLRDALRTQRVVDALWQSAMTQQSVTIEGSAR